MFAETNGGEKIQKTTEHIEKFILAKKEIKNLKVSTTKTENTVATNAT